MKGARGMFSFLFFSFLFFSFFLFSHLSGTNRAVNLPCGAWPSITKIDVIAERSRVASIAILFFLLLDGNAIK